MSLRRIALNLFLRTFEKPHLARIEDPVELRAMFERKARWLFHGPRGSTYAGMELGDVPGLKVTGPGADEAGAILYFHGGGYVFGSPRTHKAMLARLSRLTGRVAWLPDYRKAPEHAFPAAVEDALAAYRALIEMVPAGRVVIGGDSAGGGLALALLGEICRLDLPQPQACFAFSPLTDMTFSGASYSANETAEAMLPATREHDIAEMYLADADPTDPRATPLNAGFAGAGPVWLSVGDTEILLDDTRRMAEVMRAQSVEVTEVIEHDLPHVWPIFQRMLPEADATLKALARWISSR
ncbi:alpha/beta hydrolase [Marimonas lutisalis]|uniref:alpha/beta hydrolase n=1 Tax=Marimonas lutisalis TaxID=2545756 RepID=UPI0010F60667|nr:alpha/beta hydrolase [Marimonas lutisalis]